MSTEWDNKAPFRLDINFLAAKKLHAHILHGHSAGLFAVSRHFPGSLCVCVRVCVRVYNFVRSCSRGGLFVGNLSVFLGGGGGIFFFSGIGFAHVVVIVTSSCLFPGKRPRVVFGWLDFSVSGFGWH